MARSVSNAEDGLMGYHVIFGYRQANMNMIYPGPGVLVVGGFYPDLRQLKYQSKQAAGLLVFQ